MAINQCQTLETQDQSNSDIEALFCECGTLLEPQADGRAACPEGCSSHSNRGVKTGSFVVVLTQNERPELTVHDPSIDDNTPSGDYELTFTRTEFCEACGAEEPVRAKIAQTRAADEPATRLYTCRTCRNTWREHG